MSSLFSQANPGASTSGTGNNGTNGLHFTVSSSAPLSGIWHWSATGSTQLPTSIGLYTITTLGTSGTLVTSNTATWLTGPGGSAATAGGNTWVYAAFTSPPALSSGVDYMVTKFRNDTVNEWFSFYSVTWPVTSGIITAPEDKSTSALSQGWYNIGTAMAFPTTQLAGDNFGMDVEVTTTTNVTSTGSMGLASDGFSGTVTVGAVITSTGSMHQAALAFAGSGAETITSTGSFGLAANKFTGTSVETFASTGSFGQAPLAFSGTSTQTLTSTGSIGLAGLGFSGAVSLAGTAAVTTAPLGFSGTVTVQNFFTSTGSFAPAALAFNGTEAETFTSTGSMHLAVNAFSGTGVVAPPVTTTGSFGLASSTFTGTETNTFTATGSFSLASVGFNATAAVANPITSTGSFTQSALTFMASSAPVITTYGTIHMPGPAFSGTSVVLNPVATFGHTTLGILGMSGHSVVAPPVTSTGNMKLAPNGFLGATGEIVSSHQHDYAAMDDTAAVTVRVFVSDYAGAADSASGREEGVAVSVPDYAAMAETVTVSVVAGVHDYATMQEFDHAINEITPSVTVSSTFSAYSSMEESISSTFTVGKPFQSSNRQLALARWNFMYPS